jgi:fluoride ion exporter CrcB/FEX
MTGLLGCVTWFSTFVKLELEELFENKKNNRRINPVTDSIKVIIFKVTQPFL